jgi:UDP-glucose 4-epimerase
VLRTWVIGASGLIGQSVWRAAQRAGHEPRRVLIPWKAGPTEQLAALSRGLRGVVEEAAGAPWNVVWVAGAGVVGTSPEALATEAQVFDGFLGDLAGLAIRDRAPEAIFVASSAGGLYAGSSAAPFTEDSPLAPLAPYGRQKAEIERCAREFASRTGVPTMIGRITNVYGPGQNLDKAQGLVSQLGKACLLHRPISLYVSLDTTRDYIFVDDCARMIVAALDDLTGLAELDNPVVKILGSGVPATIATLLGEYRRLFRRRPPVVLGDSPNHKYQVRDLRMRSTTWPHLNRIASTTLPAGIGATVADLSKQLRRGEMAVASTR